MLLILAAWQEPSETAQKNNTIKEKEDSLQPTEIQFWAIASFTLLTQLTQEYCATHPDTSQQLLIIICPQITSSQTFYSVEYRQET